jgi:hypothetical protein
MDSEQEPDLVTDLGLAGILDELIQREPIFHRPELGTTRADFERMTHPDFWEIGASGRLYSRAYVLDELEKRHSQPHHSQPHNDVWETSHFHCRQLAPDIFLLTYTLLQDNKRKTRRTTLWQHSAEGWRILFHQGTIVQST